MDASAFQKLDAFLLSMNVKAIDSIMAHISDWDCLVLFAWVSWKTV